MIPHGHSSHCARYENLKNKNGLIFTKYDGGREFQQTLKPGKFKKTCGRQQSYEYCTRNVTSARQRMKAR
jgi:hypothetical protein